VDAKTQRLDRLNMSATSSSAPPASCEICGFIGHLTMNCQVRSPFFQDTSDQINYVNNFNPRPTNDPYSKDHPNFSYKSNPSPMPHINARTPLEFQRPPFSQQLFQKSNLEAMIERMLLAQQK